jgi:hypothetical protein
MKKSKAHLAVVASMLLLASCSYAPQPLALVRPLSEGQARLTEIEMPDYVREGLEYDVILRIDSEQTPEISRVCFRWLAEDILSPSPSHNCYAANGSFGTGTSCYPRTSVIKPGSASFCAEAPNIRTDVPGRLVVRIRPSGLQPGYNRLEGQAEYIYAGQVRVTNPVKTIITVDQE